MADDIDTIKIIFSSGFEAVGAAPPASHTHPLSEIDDAGTAAASDVGDFATSAQGAKADTAIQPGTLAQINAQVTDATLIDSADSRLSDTRDPNPHTHTEAQISDLGLTVTMNADEDVSSNSWVLNEANFLSDSPTKLATQSSIKAYVQSNTCQWKGEYNASSNTPDFDNSPTPGTIYKGDFYRVSVAGTFFTTDLSVGDVLVSEKDDPVAEADWTVIAGKLQPADIKSLYESNADTNAFTDADKVALDALGVGDFCSYKGGYDAVGNVPNLDSNPTPGSIVKGDIYTVTTDGQFYTTDVVAGDLLLAEVDDAASSAAWTVLNRDVDAASMSAAGAVMETDTTTIDMQFVIDDDTMATAGATLSTSESIKAYVDAQVGDVATAMSFQGSYDASATDPVSGTVGDVYVVSVAGTGVASFWSTQLQVGDVLIQEVSPATTEADWVVVSRDTVGDPLIASSNLSDVVSASTARTNLGVAIGSDVQAHSAVLDATTASFTTADETKLDGIEAGATTDQTGAEIKTALFAEADTNNFTDADETKLDGIEASADVTDEANVTSSLSGATITSATVAGTDKVLVQDVDDSDNLKTVTAQSIADLGGGGGGDVTKVGTPVNNQIGVWTGDGTLEGDAALTWDGQALTNNATSNPILRLKRSSGKPIILTSQNSQTALVFDDSSPFIIGHNTAANLQDGGSNTYTGDPMIYCDPASGYLGIQNGTPTEALDVTGNIAVSGNLDVSNGELLYAGDYKLTENGGRILNQRQTAGQGLIYSHATADNDGTDQIVYSLEYKGIAGDSNREAFQFACQNDEYRIISYSTGTGTLRPIIIGPYSGSLTPSIYVDPTGDVGILNETPTEALDVTGNIVSSGYTLSNSFAAERDGGNSAMANLKQTAVGGGALSAWAAPDGDANMAFAHDRGDFRLYRAAAAGLFAGNNYSNVDSDPRLFIEGSTGNVGIANDTPTEVLDVTGNIKASGTLAGSNLSGTNTGDEVAATDGAQGVVELATQTEVNMGIDTTRVVTPATLANYSGLSDADFYADGSVAMTGNLNINTRSLVDANSNELLRFDTQAGAVNEITIKNNATGLHPQISASGNDATIDLDIDAKGTYGRIFLGSEVVADRGITIETSTATATGTTTIDWRLSTVVDFTFTTSNEVFSFTNAEADGFFVLKLTQDGVGSRTVTWPAVVKWPGGTAPTLSTGAGATDIVRFEKVGTYYYGSHDLNYS